METMNYDKVKNKSNAPLIAFITFIVLGSATVAFALINEKEPVVIGENAYINVSSDNVKEEAEDIEYKVRSVTRKNDKTSYKSNIVLPEIVVEGVDLTDINEKIKDRFLTKYNTLAADSSETLENTFTYKVSYETNEVAVDGTKLLSILISETITAGKDNVFSSKKYGYTIDLKEKKILTYDEAAPLILDYSFRNKIKEQIKEYLISKKIVKEDEYNYSITGMEEYYIKDNEFHIIFNPTEPFDKKFGILDIKI